MVDKNILFENKNYNDLIQRAFFFATFYEDKKMKEVCIFLDSIFDFCAAFLGAIISRKVAHIVPKVELSNINDRILSQIKGRDSKKDFDFDLEYEFFIYTSGSTNEPKKIKKTLRQMRDEAIFLRDFLGVESIQKVLSSVSHQHLFGLTFRVFLSFVSGCKVIGEQLLYPELIASHDFSDAYFITSPVILESINPSLLDNARLIITAGSKLESAIKKQFSTEILEIYGSTETGIIAANFSKNKNQSDRFEILDPVNLSLNDGNLVVNSPWCEHFVSNDIVEIDGRNLKILGRNDRILKLNDFRFSLDDAQNSIKNHEFIKDAKCALLNPKDRVSAILLLSERGKEAFRDGGKMAITKAMDRILRGNFKTNIRHFKIVENLPKNASGKFGKADFVEIWERVVTPRFQKLDSNDSIKYSAFMSEECFFYEGHFRDFPLTPGFIQLGFVFDILQKEGIEINPSYKTQNLKWTHFLRPFDICEIEIKISKTIDFTIAANGVLCASGRICNA